MSRLRAWGLFVIDILYLVILVLLLVGRPGHFLWIDHIPNPIGGLIPAGVPWFGALGAVTISMYGVFEHNTAWDVSWNYWHLARPVVGAIFAIVSYLIFIGLINATGNTVGAKPSTPDAIPYLVVGFVVGFREQTFRTLLQRAVDIILGPGIPGQTQAAVSITANPTTVPSASNLNVPITPPIEVVVSNLGTGGQTIASVTVTVAPPNAATCQVNGFVNVAVPAQSHVTGTLSITPLANTNYTVTLTANGSFSTQPVARILSV